MLPMFPDYSVPYVPGLYRCSRREKVRFLRLMRAAVNIGMSFAAIAALIVTAVALWSGTTGHARASPVAYWAVGLVIWMPFAFVVGLLFAGCLATIARRGRAIPAPQVGAVLGGGLAGILVAALLPRGVDPISGGALIVSVIGVGAAISAGTLALAAKPSTSADETLATSQDGHLASSRPLS